MQFSIVSVIALAAVALGTPLNERDAKMLRYRQAAQRPSNPSALLDGPPVSAPAMTTRDGRIVDFDSSKVYLAAVEAGL